MADNAGDQPPQEDQQNAGNNNEGDAGENNQNAPGIQNFLMQDKSLTVLWFIRLYIIASTIFYILPFFGPEVSRNSYKRVLLGSAAISALRLHQRLPRIQFNMEFARLLMVEDSLHYLMYSVLFMMAGSATMVLSPIFLFALMHASSHTKKVLNATGNNGAIMQKLHFYIDKLQNREMQMQVFQFIAVTEIVVMAVSILMVFSGQASILVPFFYYRFLQLRYTSRRNPYSRMAFGQFNLGIQRLAYHPKCPGFARSILLGVIALANRLSPVAAAQ